MYPILFHVESRAIPGGCGQGCLPRQSAEQQGPCCNEAQHPQAAHNPPPFLNATLDELCNIAVGFESQAARLEGFNCRVLGPVPNSCCEADKPNGPNTVSAFIDAVNRLKRSQAAIEEQLLRLNQLA